MFLLRNRRNPDAVGSRKNRKKSEAINKVWDKWVTSFIHDCWYWCLFFLKLIFTEHLLWVRYSNVRKYKENRTCRESCCLVTKSYPTLGDPVDCSLPHSSVHEISQARILECVALSFFRGSSWPRDRTCTSCISYVGFFTIAQPGKLLAGRDINIISILKGGLLFSCSVITDSATPWTAARQASLPFTISWSMVKLMSNELMMPSNHLILCRPIPLLPSIFPSGSFPMSQFFALGGQLALVILKND